MAKYRKTSITPKKKPKPLPIPPKPVYPEYINSFIKDVEDRTKLTVRVCQYVEGSSYSVTVLRKLKHVHRSIWTKNLVTTPEQLVIFWDSEAFKELSVS